MIVVVASAYDARARDLVAHWGSQCATLLSAEDLSRAGWAFQVSATQSGSFVADGRIVPEAAITGILTLRPRIFPPELGHVAPSDRDYVAAEMTAVLLAWLAAQRCPVLNAPSAGALAGPNWRPARWRYVASELGIPIAPTNFPADDDLVEVMTVAKQHFGPHESRLAAWVAALARAAGTDLLGCRFTQDGRFVIATPWPALDQLAVRDLLRDQLSGRA